jgi:putative transposase
MNAPKVDELDYIQFLIAAQRVFTCTEAATCQPEQAPPPAHDAFTRLLARQPPDTAALWREVKPLIAPGKGALLLDNSTLDKPYAKHMALVTPHWSGKHHRVVMGINLFSLVWTDGEALLPCDFRIYDKPFGGQDLFANAYFSMGASMRLSVQEPS